MHIKDLSAASFRGAGFLAPRSSTAEGRNSIVHDYPDQAMRYVEDNGAIPPEFDVTAYLTGDGLPGKVSALRAALMRPGPGVLKHPAWGTQFVMVDQQYTVEHNDQNAGIVEFKLKFIATGAPIFPGLLSGIAAVVSQIGASAVTAAFEAYQNQYIAPTGPSSIEAVAAAVAEIGQSLAAAFPATSGGAQQIIEKAGLLAQAQIAAGPAFSAAFRAPLNEISYDSPAIIEGLDAARLSSLAVKARAEAINAATPDLASRATAIISTAEFTEFAAFVGLAEAMASRAYVTSNEVDADEELLNNAFASLQSGGLPAEQHDVMAQVYIATADILGRAAVRLPRVQTVEVTPLPASVLAYSLYEQDGMNIADLPQHHETLLGLNPDADPGYVGPQVAALLRT